MRFLYLAPTLLMHSPLCMAFITLKENVWKRTSQIDCYENVIKTEEKSNIKSRKREIPAF